MRKVCGSSFRDGEGFGKRIISGTPCSSLLHDVAGQHVASSCVVAVSKDFLLLPHHQSSGSPLPMFVLRTAPLPSTFSGFFLPCRSISVYRKGVLLLFPSLPRPTTRPDAAVVANELSPGQVSIGDRAVVQEDCIPHPQVIRWQPTTKQAEHQAIVGLFFALGGEEEHIYCYSPRIQMRD